MNTFQVIKFPDKTLESTNKNLKNQEIQLIDLTKTQIIRQGIRLGWTMG
jgi:hypothetical protein